MCVIINEASKTKYQKKYKCPFCEARLTRQDMPIHIQKIHEELIPEGYTATRVAFNTINKKTHGTCTICKRESPWNEHKARYDRLCGRKECSDENNRIVKERTKNKHGTEDMLNDPRYKEMQQRKMLANRKISGQYTFQNGVKRGYTGKYEKNFLEFMDLTLNVLPEDLTEGPAIEYDFQGKRLMYISDYYYIPYNLIIEIKDGGSNPNNRNMVEYRQKQTAKEIAIEHETKYNYIRLTDNNFAQLMETFAELKYNLTEGFSDERVININENVIEGMASVIGAALPRTDAGQNSSQYFMVNNLKNNVYSISRDPAHEEIITVDPDDKKIKFQKKPIDEDYAVFEMVNFEKASKLYEIAVQLAKMETIVENTDFFYNQYTFRNVLTNDQIFFDESFRLVKNFNMVIEETNKNILDYINTSSRIRDVRRKISNISESIGDLINLTL